MKKLVICSLVLMTLTAAAAEEIKSSIKESCNLQKFEIEKDLKLDKAVESSIDSFNALGLTFATGVQESDFKIINNVNDPAWNDIYGKLKEEFEMKARRSGIVVSYAALDEQGLMFQSSIEFKIKGQPKNATLAVVSSGPMKSQNDFKKVDAKVMAITVDGKNYASVKDLYISLLANYCCEGLKEDVTKDPVIGAIKSFGPTEDCWK
jgi:hypothetical protein